MTDPKKTTSQPEMPADEIEIVELDERLDMAIDPLAIAIAMKSPDTQCHNKTCCPR